MHWNSTLLCYEGQLSAMMDSRRHAIDVQMRIELLMCTIIEKRISNILISVCYPTHANVQIAKLRVNIWHRFFGMERKLLRKQ